MHIIKTYSNKLGAGQPTAGLVRDSKKEGIKKQCGGFLPEQFSPAQMLPFKIQTPTHSHFLSH
jgi:hypothetical protein